MGVEPSPLPWAVLRSIKDPRERRMLWMSDRARLARMLEGYGRQAPPWPREALLAECRNEDVITSYSIHYTKLYDNAGCDSEE